MEEMPQAMKEHVKNLISEFRDIATNIFEIRKKPRAERMKVHKRLEEIKKELEEIKEKYKND